MLRMLPILSFAALAACGTDSAPTPDADQTQQIADGTGATAPVSLQLYALAGRMDAPAAGSIAFDLAGFHVDASATCRDDTGEARTLCTPPDAIASVDYHLALRGVIDLPVWHGALTLVADLTVTRGAGADDHLVTGTSHLDLTSSTLDRTLAIDTSADLVYHPSTNMLDGTIATGIDATLSGANTHVDDALLTLTPAGKLHLRFDGTACFAIDTTTGAATRVDVTTCE
jgi:hypothetical protein